MSFESTIIADTWKEKPYPPEEESKIIFDVISSLIPSSFGLDDTLTVLTAFESRYKHRYLKNPKKAIPTIYCCLCKTQDIQFEKHKILPAFEIKIQHFNQIYLNFIQCNPAAKRRHFVNKENILKYIRKYISFSLDSEHNLIEQYINAAIARVKIPKIIHCHTRILAALIYIKILKTHNYPIDLPEFLRHSKICFSTYYNNLKFHKINIIDENL
jgi:hypothetical protein